MHYVDAYEAARVNIYEMNISLGECFHYTTRSKCQACAKKLFILDVRQRKNTFKARGRRDYAIAEQLTSK